MVCLAPLPTPQTLSAWDVAAALGPLCCGPSCQRVPEPGCSVPTAALGRLSPNCLTLLLRNLLIPSLITPGQLLPDVVHTPNCPLA